MEILSAQGGAFSEFYLKKLLPNETRLAARLDRPGRLFRGCSCPERNGPAGRRIPDGGGSGLES